MWTLIKGLLLKWALLKWLLKSLGSLGILVPVAFVLKMIGLPVLMVLAVLYVNWRHIVVPELNIVFYATGLMTAFSGVHYLVRGLRQWHFNG